MRDAQADIDAIDLSYVPNPIYGPFTLPTNAENGSTITWLSDYPGIILIIGNSAIVFKQDNPVSVPVIAMVTKGKAVVTKFFTVNVAERDTSYVDANLNNVTKTSNADGTKTFSLGIEYGDVSYDSLTFMGILEDENGDIIDRQSFVLNSLEAGRGKTATLSLIVPEQYADRADDYKLYIWGDSSITKNVSLINHSPSDLLNLTSVEKVKNITLTWDPCYDDDSDPVEYEIWRDGSYYDRTILTTYKDINANNGTHTYSVRPIDARSNYGVGKDTDSCKTIPMYFFNAYEVRDGIDKAYGSNLNSMCYATYRNVKINGVNTRVITANGFNAYDQKYAHYIGFTTPFNVISRKDRNVVIEVDWIDHGNTNFYLYYNAALPIGKDGKVEYDSSTYGKANGYTFKKSKNELDQGEIKTEVIRLNDAEFRASSQLGSASFAIGVPSGTDEREVAITEIRIIKADLYD